MVRRPDMTQFAQRVVASFHLPAMAAEQVRDYIGHRLAVAGATTPVFSRAAADLRPRGLARGAAAGQPALRPAMVYAFTKNERSVSRATVQEVIDDGVFFGGGAHGRPDSGCGGSEAGASVAAQAFDARVEKDEMDLSFYLRVFLRRLHYVLLFLLLGGGGRRRRWRCSCRRSTAPRRGWWSRPSRSPATSPQSTVQVERHRAARDHPAADPDPRDAGRDGQPARHLRADGAAAARMSADEIVEDMRERIGIVTTGGPAADGPGPGHHRRRSASRPPPRSSPRRWPTRW